MAELGNLFGQSSAQEEAKVEVEMLDYGYVNDCTDWKQLNAILNVLKSGKEGIYPDLIKVTENRLVELLPAKEKKKYTSMNHKLTPGEIAEAEADLSSWRRAAQQTDDGLAKVKQADTNAKKKRVVPVRGSARAPAAAESGVGEAKGSPGREGEGAALLSVRAVTDLRDGAIGPDIAALINVGQRKKLEKLQQDLAVFEMAEVKREYKAGLEKTKGNESFRIADNEDALLCYSRSIAYEPRNAVVWANRAMAYIRQEVFDLAEADAGVALLLDPAYTKAYSRRGLVRFKRGKYLGAVQDFRCALDLDGGNAELGKLLEAARQKHADVEGVALTEAQETGAAAEGGQELRTLTVRAVGSVLELLLPADLSAALLLGEGVLEEAPAGTAATNGSGGFVRIAVASDDSDGSDEEDGAGQHTQQGGFQRVAIVADSDSEEEEEGEAMAEVDSRSAEERAVEAKESGNALMKRGQLQESVHAYSASLLLLPQYLPALNNRAQAHLLLRDFRAAEADCCSVLLLEPRNLKALFRRAAARKELGHSAACLADLLAVLSADPANTAALALKQDLDAEGATAAAKASTAASTAASVAASVAASAAASASASSVAPPAPPSASEELDVQALKRSAQQLLGQGLNDKVVALLGRHLRAVGDPLAPFSALLQSDQTSLLHLLASAYAASGDQEHAVFAYGALLSLDGSNARALQKRAEAQLRGAEGETDVQRRSSALSEAEGFLQEALAQQPGSADLLALRRELLRLRNMNPGALGADSAGKGKTAAPSSPSSGPSGSRQQSDAEKERGNAAMAARQYSTAVTHYNNALKFDAGNVAAANNRALAHLKLRNFEQAAADASLVLAATAGAEAGAEGQALRLKALCRRAQAHRGEAEALIEAGRSGAAELLQRAAGDLQTLLTLDGGNKTGLKEQQDVQRLQQKAMPLIGKQQPETGGTSAEGKGGMRAGADSSSGAASPPPRADMQRVSSLLSQPKGASAGGSFDGMGMVARSSKKIHADGSTTDAPVPVPEPAPSTPVAAAGSSADKKKKKSTPSSAASAGGSPGALTAAPSDPPKTLYELERVWRGLKSRPELFAAYVQCFKKGTWKRVCTEAVSPDLLSYLWTCLRDHASAQEQVKALLGFSGVPGFSLSVSLMPEQDAQCVHGMLRRLSSGADVPAELAAGVQELCVAYGLP